MKKHYLVDTNVIIDLSKGRLIYSLYLCAKMILHHFSSLQVIFLKKK